MRDYEELVKRLRDAAKMSVALLLPHSEGNAMAKLYNEAADSIEELSAIREEQKAQIIAMAAEGQHWIPVTERLPEEYENVLLLSMSGEIISGYYDSEYKSYCDMSGFRKLCTHWMPLPEPPKEE